MEDERGGIICPARTWNKWVEGPIPERVAEGPLPCHPPRLVILGSLEAGVSHWSECPGWCTQYESGGPLASPRLGPSICWCLTELCGQVQGSQGSAAPAGGSLLKASILVSCHHHCQPDGSGFSPGRGSAEPGTLEGLCWEVDFLWS